MPNNGRFRFPGNGIFHGDNTADDSCTGQQLVVQISTAYPPTGGSPMATYPRLLTVAGSDFGGGAGIQTDLKTFTALGAFGMSGITAVTAQNTRDVVGVYPMTPAQVNAQLDAVLTDIGIDAIKTDMLLNASIIEAIAVRLSKNVSDTSRNSPRSFNLVIDPVMIAKSCDALLEDNSIKALHQHLLPLGRVVTSNVPEAEVLTCMTVRHRDDMVAAAR